MGVDRHRVCELYAAGRDVEGSGSGYRLGDRLVLTARHVISPSLAGPGSKLLVRPAGEGGWLPARVEWQDADADAALIVVEDEGWRPRAGESVLRWGKLVGSDPVPCAAVEFPWASARPDRTRDTAHLYGHLTPLGQLKAGRLDLDVVSASPSARAGGSPWAGMSGAGVIADNHLVGVITVDPARYQDRLVAVSAAQLLTLPGFLACLDDHGVPAEVLQVGAGWHLQLPGDQTVSLDAAYRPVSRRFRPALPALLRPEHGLVPFLGRQALLDRITGWCQESAGRPVMLVTGGGGSGKTRLGREACVQMLVAGWDAGLADDQHRSGAATARLQRPTLLVIDDADLRTSLITSLIGYMRWDDTGPEVRLLLLARTPGAWWDRLIRQQDLASAYTVLDLDRYPIPSAGRAEHFRQAATAFAAYRDTGAPPADVQPPTDLEDPAYQEPLLIHIAALLSTVGTNAIPPPGLGEETGKIARQPVRQALLQALCERERARWYQLGEHLSFNPDLPLVDQVVALATLTAAADQPCATSLLVALPNQAEVTRIGAESLVMWAHKLYAGPAYWNPLRPDLIAEQHLADTPQLASLAAASTQLAAGQQWETRLFTQLLAELTRAAPTQSAVQAALSELLVAALPRIIDLAVTAGQDGLADLASLALQLAPQPGLAAQLAGQMPEHSVQAAALAATLTSQQVTHYRAITLDGGPDATKLLAISLSNLAVRLAGVGRLEDALAAAEEATGIHRELAEARPDAFRPDLARSLNNLAAELAGVGAGGRADGDRGSHRHLPAAGRSPAGRLPPRPGQVAEQPGERAGRPGRREDALTAIEEATGIYRELAEARPDAFRHDLAISLNNLAARLAGVGRREDALAAAEEATGIYRELAQARPDAFRPDLARSLSNLSPRLADLGRREDALTAIEEAVTIRRELAQARPDAFRPGLAASLSSLSAGLYGVGRREDALAAIEEAVTIRRELAQARPDAFRPGLAASLNNLSNGLYGVAAGRRAGRDRGSHRHLPGAGSGPAGRLPPRAGRVADQPVERAVRGGPAGRRADGDRGSRHDPPGAGSGPAGRLPSRPGHVAEQPGGPAVRGGPAGRRAGRDRGSHRYLPGTGRSPAGRLPSRPGHVTEQPGGPAGRPGPAGRCADGDRGSHRHLPGTGSGPAGRLPPRAGSVAEQPVGPAVRGGPREDALTAIEEAVTIRRELAQARPDAFRPDLAVSLSNLSARLYGVGRREDALTAIEEAVTIRRELAQARPDAFRPDLAASLNNLAIQLYGVGTRREDALTAIEEATGISRELARPGRTPSAPTWPCH